MRQEEEEGEGDREQGWWGGEGRKEKNERMQEVRRKEGGVRQGEADGRHTLAPQGGEESAETLGHLATC